MRRESYNGLHSALKWSLGTNEIDSQECDEHGARALNGIALLCMKQSTMMQRWGNLELIGRARSAPCISFPPLSTLMMIIRYYYGL